MNSVLQMNYVCKTTYNGGDMFVTCYNEKVTYIISKSRTFLDNPSHSHTTLCYSFVKVSGDRLCICLFAVILDKLNLFLFWFVGSEWLFNINYFVFQIITFIYILIKKWSAWIYIYAWNISIMNCYSRKKTQAASNVTISYRNLAWQCTGLSI